MKTSFQQSNTENLIMQKTLIRPLSSHFYRPSSSEDVLFDETIGNIQDIIIGELFW